MARRIIVPQPNGKEPRRVSAEVISQQNPSTALAIRAFFSGPPNRLELPDNLTFEQCLAFASQLSRVAGAVRWWIGDLLNFSKRHFEEQQMRQVIDALKLNDGREYGESAIEQARWVTSRIPPNERDARLTWNHYVAIAKFRFKSDREYWENRTIKESLTTRALKAAIATDTKAKKSRTASEPVSSLARFDNDRLLLKVRQSTQVFFEALDTAQMQFTDKCRFNYAALRSPTEVLHGTLSELLAALAMPQKRGAASPAPARELKTF